MPGDIILLRMCHFSQSPCIVCRDFGQIGILGGNYQFNNGDDIIQEELENSLTNSEYESQTKKI